MSNHENEVIKDTLNVILKNNKCFVVKNVILLILERIEKESEVDIIDDFGDISYAPEYCFYQSKVSKERVSLDNVDEYLKSDKQSLVIAALDILKNSSRLDKVSVVSLILSIKLN